MQELKSLGGQECSVSYFARAYAAVWGRAGLCAVVVQENQALVILRHLYQSMKNIEYVCNVLVYVYECTLGCHSLSAVTDLVGPSVKNFGPVAKIFLRNGTLRFGWA